MDAPQTPADPRALLLAERARVLEEVADNQVEAPGQMTYGSQAAAATHVFEQQRDLALLDHNRQHLAAIDAALARLAAGTYGRLHRVREPDPAERLEALPWTALCIDCSRTARRR